MKTAILAFVGLASAQYGYPYNYGSYYGGYNAYPYGYSAPVSAPVALPAPVAAPAAYPYNYGYNYGGYGAYGGYPAMGGYGGPQRAVSYVSPNGVPTVGYAGTYTDAWGNQRWTALDETEEDIVDAPAAEESP